MNIFHFAVGLTVGIEYMIPTTSQIQFLQIVFIYLKLEFRSFFIFFFIFVNQTWYVCTSFVDGLSFE